MSCVFLPLQPKCFDAQYLIHSRCAQYTCLRGKVVSDGGKQIIHKTKAEY